MSSSQYPTNTDASANHQNIIAGSAGINEPIDLTVKHHVHRDNEPLPGAKGGAQPVDYNPEVIEHTKLPPSEEGDTQDFSRRERHHQQHPSHQQGDASSTPLEHNPTGSGAPHTTTGNTTNTTLKQETHVVPIQHMPSQHLSQPQRPSEGPHSHPSSFHVTTPDKTKSFDINGNEKNPSLSQQRRMEEAEITNDDDPLGYGKFGGAGRAPKVGDITANMNEHEGSSDQREGTGLPVGVPADSLNKHDGGHSKTAEVKDTVAHPTTHFKEDVNLNKDNAHRQPAHKDKVSLGDKVIGKTQQIAGKLVHNEELKEKGEVRSHGGGLN
ncbi:hypothetical protein CPC08DRAFT_374989 [Agrocybe pediades]|nr:hypothetical protein CPC08DRAFT_374989 [Agrocybe pediades]